MRQYGKYNNRYLGNIKHKGVPTHLGVFNTAEECKNAIIAFKNLLNI